MRTFTIAFAAATLALSGSPASAKQCFDSAHKFTKCGGPNDVTSAAPAPTSTPVATATVSASSIMCKDGTKSAAASTRGACSRHGGVQSMSATTATHATTSAPAPAPAAAPAPASTRPMSMPKNSSAAMPAAGQVTATCKDGTTSMSQHHSGTCSHHGGVASWAK